MVEEKDVYTFVEAAEIADVDPATLRYAKRGGRLDAFKEKGEWRIKHEELYRWMNDKSAHKPGPKKHNKTI